MEAEPPQMWMNQQKKHGELHCSSTGNLAWQMTIQTIHIFKLRIMETYTVHLANWKAHGYPWPWSLRFLHVASNTWVTCPTQLAGFMWIEGKMTGVHPIHWIYFPWIPVDVPFNQSPCAKNWPGIAKPPFTPKHHRKMGTVNTIHGAYGIDYWLVFFFFKHAHILNPKKHHSI